MADGVTELLSVKQWLRAHNDKVLYTTTPTAETPPASGSATVPVDSSGGVQAFLLYRFAEVRALDGDLLVRLKQALDTAPAATPNSMLEGELRVLNGTSRTFQIANGTVLYIQTVTGTVNGAVNWGR